MNFDPHNRRQEGWQSIELNSLNSSDVFNVIDRIGSTPFFFPVENNPYWDVTETVQQEPVTIYNVVAAKKESADHTVDLSQFTIVSSFLDRTKAEKLRDSIKAFAADNVDVEVYPSILEQ